MFGFIVPVIFIVALLASMLRVLNEYERGVVFRLGRIIGIKGPGLIILLPVIDQMKKVPLRTVVLDVPPQDIITKDNVSVKVNAVVYFKVVDPTKAILEVEDYIYATSQLAQTTLRSVLGGSDMDDLLAHRDKINSQLQSILDKATDPWGVKGQDVELKHVDLPQEMQRAMAKQAEAERERRAKVIAADGEFQAAAKLHEASIILAKEPVAIQLRYLQTLSEIAVDNNTTTIFPVPIDLFKWIKNKAENPS